MRIVRVEQQLEEVRFWKEFASMRPFVLIIAVAHTQHKQEKQRHAHKGTHARTHRYTRTHTRHTCRLLQQSSADQLDQIESEMTSICESFMSQFGHAIDRWPNGPEDTRESTWMSTLAEKVESVLWKLAQRQPTRTLYTCVF